MIICQEPLREYFLSRQEFHTVFESLIIVCRGDQDWHNRQISIAFRCICGERNNGKVTTKYLFYNIEREKEREREREREKEREKERYFSLNFI